MSVNFRVKSLFSSIVVVAFSSLAQSSWACGGFFCENVPINQAAEQIVFRQQGAETTAMIKIDYVGEAEDFGWVLPVPDTPEISLGSDLTFTELEVNTRPQFLLERVGEACSAPESLRNTAVLDIAAGAPIAVADSSVVIEQTLSVGAFDAQVVSSDDSEALALWLSQNNLDLTNRGSELLAPYIESKSKFVVLKLKSNASVGSIQPIILKYRSSVPVIPMTLTAVAATDDMGVLVWLLGDGRGVPKNFKHVTPNYTRLNWFNGTRSAYASYQTLITEAMDEAGGQGFATDYAGYQPNLIEQLTTSSNWEGESGQLAEMASLSDSTFISTAWDSLNPIIQGAIRTLLPTSDAFVYSRPLTLTEVFTEDQLALARTSVVTTIQEQVVAPLANSIDLFDDGLYLTRLYTTLSADEMDRNPEFTFNTAMEGQQLTRNAMLTASCVDDETSWSLKLGKGTGREDELVVEAWEPVPFSAVGVDQKASWRVENTSATADPILVAENDFQVLSLGTKPEAKSSNSSGGSLDWLFLWMCSAVFMFARHKKEYN